VPRRGKPPVSTITNKHLYPIQALVDACIPNILVVTGGRIRAIFCACSPKGSLPVPSLRYAAIGIYRYDDPLFDKVKPLVPSRRGELEITDVNNAYIVERHRELPDAGTFESLLRAANLVTKTWCSQQQGVNQDNGLNLQAGTPA